MKTIFYTIIVLLLVSSCGNSINVVTKFNSNKSKYTKGLKFSNQKKQNYSQKKDFVEVNDEYKINSTIKLENIELFFDTINEVEKNNLKRHTNTVITNKIVPLISKIKVDKNKADEYITPKIKSNFNKKLVSNKKEYSLLLLVLLAFLIPFLAVGLKSNWDLVKVIIALILWPTIFLSILFALLVVYDILEF